MALGNSQNAAQRDKGMKRMDRIVIVKTHRTLVARFRSKLFSKGDKATFEKQ